MYAVLTVTSGFTLFVKFEDNFKNAVSGTGSVVHSPDPFRSVLYFIPYC